MGIPLYGQEKAGGKLGALLDKKRVYKFENPPVIIDDAVYGATATLPDGADTSVCIHQYTDGLNLAVEFIGASTIDGPELSSLGMVYESVDTDDRGMQWATVHASAKGTEGVNQFTVGNAAFYAKLRLKIGTVGSADECGFGIRKKAAFAALPQTYTDYVMLNVDNGDIKAQGALNDTDESDVDTTDNWGNNEIHTLEVRVAKSGAATFKIDGADPTVNTFSMTFDAGDVVHPFFFQLKDACAALDPTMIELEMGLQDDESNSGFDVQV